MVGYSFLKHVDVGLLQWVGSADNCKFDSVWNLFQYITMRTLIISQFLWY